VLRTGRGGLTLKEQEELYNVINDLDAPMADGSAPPRISTSFQDATAFKRAISDDLDAAVLAAGWQKVTLKENGEQYHAYFRPVLHVVLALLDGRRVVRMLSGEGGSAPASNRRESPLEGDDFRACEAEVCARAGRNCVLGIHDFSDSSRLSWSGGTFWARACAFVSSPLVVARCWWDRWGSGVHLNDSHCWRGVCIRFSFSHESAVTAVNLLIFCFFLIGSTQAVPRPHQARKLIVGRRRMAYGGICPNRPHSQGDQRSGARQDEALRGASRCPLPCFSYSHSSQFPGRRRCRRRGRCCARLFGCASLRLRPTRGESCLVPPRGDLQQALLCLPSFGR